MDLGLNRAHSELASAFLSLESPRDVAALLEVPYKVLNYHLYVARDSQKYNLFEIPKKSGGSRRICAPATPIKILQSKLNLILQHVYRTKPPVHGFLYYRSVVTNAARHTSMNYVLNVDLLDFFPSINFGRVYGMFCHKPYKLPKEVATVLAKLCTFENQLPQGAPSSPIVSNMICARLDGELYRLAKRLDCRYTRYADDLTFSTNNPDFPESLAKCEESAIPRCPRIAVGFELKEVIESNGFTVNPSKVSLQPSDSCQRVTGLTVNQFPNVSRKYTNQIRAMIHAWEKYGLEAAENEFFKRTGLKYKAPFKPRGTFRQIVRGRLEFLRSVRGPRNPMYLKFCEQLAQFDPESATIWANIQRLTKPTELQDVVFIVESEDNQGTAFLLEGTGLVTCEHVLHPRLVAFRCTNPDDKFPLRVVNRCEQLDIAVLEIEKDKLPRGLDKGDSSRMRAGDAIDVVGFPSYAPGSSIQVYPGVIAGHKKHFGQKRFLVSATIYHGASGSPVLNDSFEVIGIAVVGDEKPGKVPENRFGVIPINLIDSLVDT